MQTRTLAIAGAVGAAALLRIIPHPANVAPITAMALFGGAMCASRRLAFALPLAALFLSDVLLEFTTHAGFYTGWLATGWGFHRTWWGVYGATVLITALGLLLRGRQRSAPAIAAATLAGSLVFFFVTNFVVWLDGGVGYPHTLAGLAACYTAALPFYRNSLAGDAVFVTALFGGFALAERWLPALRPAPRSA